MREFQADPNLVMYSLSVFGIEVVYKLLGVEVLRISRKHGNWIFTCYR
jgi:hypothetical protein